MATYHTTTMEKGDEGRYNVIKIIPSSSSTKQDWIWNNGSHAGNQIPSTSHLLDWKMSEAGHGARPGERNLADGIYVKKVEAKLTVDGDRVVIRDESSAGDVLLDLRRTAVTGMPNSYDVYGVASSDSTIHESLFHIRGTEIAEIEYRKPRLMKPYLHDSSPNNCTFGNGSSRAKCWVKIHVDDSRRQP